MTQHDDDAHREVSSAADNEDRSPQARADAARDARAAVDAVGALPDLTGTAVVVMGISGSGKSALALRLTEAFGVPYAEADDFHSPEAIATMHGGTPLTDEDRWPWLGRIRDWLSRPECAGGAVVTCSALKRSYRDLLADAPVRVRFLHVQAGVDEIQDRMEHRSHFMPASLLPSQLATLQPLQEGEDGVVLANESTLQDLTERALRVLSQH